MFHILPLVPFLSLCPDGALPARCFTVFIPSCSLQLKSNEPKQFGFKYAERKRNSDDASRGSGALTEGKIAGKIRLRDPNVLLSVQIWQR